MQQTSQYKLNKPEADDPIEIAKLNENADKLEAALLAEAAARASALGALSARVQTVEGKRIACGTVSVQSGQEAVVTLDFAPYALITHHPNANVPGFATISLPGQNGFGVQLQGNTFKITPGTGISARIGPHNYIAFG